MKFFIVVALLIAAASAEYILKTREDLNLARKECVAEFKVSTTLVEEYKKRIFSAEGPTPCYLRCIFVHLGLFDDKKGYLIDEYMKQVGRGDSIREGVTGCFDNTGTDFCMWAYRGFMCLNKGGFLPEGY